MSKAEIKACVEKELDEMVWTDTTGGNVSFIYYGHPLGRSVCAIKKTYDLSGKPFFRVFWDGFGLVQSRDLNTLKKDVEQLVRIKRTKEF